jgi:hypothetical protein
MSASSSATSRVERAVREGDAKRLGLRSVEAGAIAEEAAMDAGGRQPFLAEHAGAVRISEGHDHDLATLDPLDVAADVLDDADRFVAHALPLDVRAPVVGPQIAAADAGTGDADHRVGGFDDRGVGDVLDGDVVCLVHDRCTHVSLPF